MKLTAKTACSEVKIVERAHYCYNRNDFELIEVQLNGTEPKYFLLFKKEFVVVCRSNSGRQ